MSTMADNVMTLTNVQKEQSTATKMPIASITKAVSRVNVKVDFLVMALTNARKMINARVLIAVSMATVSMVSVNAMMDSNSKTVNALILMNVKKLVLTNTNAKMPPAKIPSVHTSASVPKEHDSRPTVKLAKISTNAWKTCTTVIKMLFASTP